MLNDKEQVLGNLKKLLKEHVNTSHDYRIVTY